MKNLFLDPVNEPRIVKNDFVVQSTLDRMVIATIAEHFKSSEDFVSLKSVSSLIREVVKEYARFLVINGAREISSPEEATTVLASLGLSPEYSIARSKRNYLENLQSHSSKEEILEDSKEEMLERAEKELEKFKTHIAKFNKE